MLGLWHETDERSYEFDERFKSHNDFPHGANTNRFMIIHEGLNSSALRYGMIDVKASN